MRHFNPPRPLPLWRSILFVPAVSERFVESAFRQPADLLQIDLEDSIGPLEKDAARAAAGAIADRFAAAGRDVSVRVNRPWRLLVRDLEAVVRTSVLAIALPKIPDASFVRSVGEVLDELERERGMPPGHTRIIGMVEDAEGLSNMNDIASAHPRMVGLIVGAEDLAVSMHMAVDDDGLYVPNVLGVAAARRAGIIPVGFIGSVVDFKDTDAFRARIRRARRLGFDAAFCVHPSQVPVINEEFAPSAAEVAYATALVAEFEHQVEGGRAAFTYQGRMVDLPIVDQARLVLTRHAAFEARARKT
jgi:citrate lyase subunit beta/citryl-CoA lyase